MEMKVTNKKSIGEGRKLPGAGKHGCSRQWWLKVAVAATRKPDDSGCASSSWHNDTNVCVFSPSHQFALPIFPSLCLSPLFFSSL